MGKYSIFLKDLEDEEEEKRRQGLPMDLVSSGPSPSFSTGNTLIPEAPEPAPLPEMLPILGAVPVEVAPTGKYKNYLNAIEARDDEIRNETSLIDAEKRGLITPTRPFDLTPGVDSEDFATPDPTAPPPERLPSIETPTAPAIQTQPAPLYSPEGTTVTPSPITPEIAAGLQGPGDGAPGPSDVELRIDQSLEKHFPVESAIARGFTEGLFQTPKLTGFAMQAVGYEMIASRAKYGQPPGPGQDLVDIGRAMERSVQDAHSLLRAKRPSEFENVGDFVIWAGESLGQAMGSTAPIVAASVTGAAAGPAVAIGAGSLVAYTLILGEIYSQGLDEITGGNREATEEEKKRVSGLSMVVAVPAAALEFLGLAAMRVLPKAARMRLFGPLLRRILDKDTPPPPETVREVLTRTAQGMGLAGVAEDFTEMGQTTMGKGVGKIATGNDWTEDDALEIVEAGLAGFVGGAGISAAPRVIEENRSRTSPEAVEYRRKLDEHFSYINSRVAELIEEGKTPEEALDQAIVEKARQGPQVDDKGRARVARPGEAPPTPADELGLGRYASAEEQAQAEAASLGDAPIAPGGPTTPIDTTGEPLYVPDTGTDATPGEGVAAVTPATPESSEGEVVDIWHNSPEGDFVGIDESRFSGNLFNGVFGNEGGSSYGGRYSYRFDIPRQKIMSHADFTIGLPYEKTQAAVKKVAGDNSLSIDDESIEGLWDFIAEEKQIQGENDLRDEDGFLDGGKIHSLTGESDPGEADWKLQKMRGQVARELGYSAVEIKDEYGTSVLVVDPDIKPSVRKDTETGEITSLAKGELIGDGVAAVAPEAPEAPESPVAPEEIQATPESSAPAVGEPEPAPESESPEMAPVTEEERQAMLDEAKAIFPEDRHEAIDEIVEAIGEDRGRYNKHRALLDEAKAAVVEPEEPAIIEEQPAPAPDSAPQTLQAEIDKREVPDEVVADLKANALESRDNYDRAINMIQGYPAKDEPTELPQTQPVQPAMTANEPAPPAEPSTPKSRIIDLRKEIEKATTSEAIDDVLLNVEELVESGEISERMADNGVLQEAANRRREELRKPTYVPPPPKAGAPKRQIPARDDQLLRDLGLVQEEGKEYGGPVAIAVATKTTDGTVHRAEPGDAHVDIVFNYAKETEPDAESSPSEAVWDYFYGSVDGFIAPTGEFMTREETAAKIEAQRGREVYSDYAESNDMLDHGELIDKALDAGTEYNPKTPIARAVAIQLPDGTVIEGLRGDFHGGLVNTYASRQGISDAEAEVVVSQPGAVEGFVTPEGEFIDRDEADRRIYQRRNAEGRGDEPMPLESQEMMQSGDLIEDRGTTYHPQAVQRGYGQLGGPNEDPARSLKEEIAARQNEAATGDNAKDWTARNVVSPRNRLSIEDRIDLERAAALEAFPSHKAAFPVDTTAEALEILERETPTQNPAREALKKLRRAEISERQASNVVGLMDLDQKTKEAILEAAGFFEVRNVYEIRKGNDWVKGTKTQYNKADENNRRMGWSVVNRGKYLKADPGERRATYSRDLIAAQLDHAAADALRSDYGSFRDPEADEPLLGHGRVERMMSWVFSGNPEPTTEELGRLPGAPSRTESAESHEAAQERMREKYGLTRANVHPYLTSNTVPAAKAWRNAQPNQEELATDIAAYRAAYAAKMTENVQPTPYKSSYYRADGTRIEGDWLSAKAIYDALPDAEKGRVDEGIVSWIREIIKGPEGALYMWYQDVGRGLMGLVGEANMGEAAGVFAVTSEGQDVKGNSTNTLYIMGLARDYMKANGGVFEPGHINLGDKDPVPHTEGFATYIWDHRTMPNGNVMFLAEEQANRIAGFYDKGIYKGGAKTSTYALDVFRRSRDGFFPFSVNDVHIARALGYRRQKMTERDIYRRADGTIIENEKRRLAQHIYNALPEEERGEVEIGATTWTDDSKFTSDSEYLHAQYLISRAAQELGISPDQAQAALWFYAKTRLSAVKDQDRKQMGTWEEAEGYLREVGVLDFAESRIDKGQAIKPELADPTLAYSKGKLDINTEIVEHLERLGEEQERGRGITVSARHGMAPGAISDVDQIQFRQEIWDAIKDPTGTKIQGLLDIGIDHTASFNQGTFLGVPEYNLFVRMPYANDETADFVSSLLSDALMQRAAVWARPKRYTDDELRDLSPADQAARGQGVWVVPPSGQEAFTPSEVDLIQKALNAADIDLTVMPGQASINLLNFKDMSGVDDDTYIRTAVRIIQGIVPKADLTAYNFIGAYHDEAKQRGTYQGIMRRARSDIRQRLSGSPDFQARLHDHLYGPIDEATERWAAAKGWARVADYDPDRARGLSDPTDIASQSNTLWRAMGLRDPTKSGVLPALRTPSPIPTQPANYVLPPPSSPGGQPRARDQGIEVPTPAGHPGVPTSGGIRTGDPLRSPRSTEETVAKGLQTVSAANGREPGVRGGIALLGRQLRSEDERKGYIKLDDVARPIVSAHDVAVISQVFRTPSREHMRVLYVGRESGRVLGHENYTSHNIDSAYLPFSENIDQEKFARLRKVSKEAADAYYDPIFKRNHFKLWDRMRRVVEQAAEPVDVYLLHNHPSADPLPSGIKDGTGDIGATKAFAYNFPVLEGAEFKGHVIIDTTDYSIVAPDGTWELYDLVTGQPTKREGPSSARDLSDPFVRPEAINESVARVMEDWAVHPVMAMQDVAQIADELNHPANFVSLVSVDNLMRTVSLGQVPAGFFKSADFANYLSNAMERDGAAEVFAYYEGDDQALMRRADEMIQANQLQELVYLPTDAAEARSLLGDIAPSMPYRWKSGARQRAGGILERVSDEGAGYLPPGDPQREENLASFLEGSVVRDVMYHGTHTHPEAFFREGGLAGHFGTVEQANDKKDFDFQGDLAGQGLMPVHLSIKNPVRMADVHFDDVHEMLEDITGDGPPGSSVFPLTEEEADAFAEEYNLSEIEGQDEHFRVMGHLVDLLKSKGFDGIVYSNRIEGESEEDSYIPFDPEQIKSATGNVGAFDPSDPSIIRDEGLVYGPEREANFKAWFGDSKVVGDNGEPLVVYHGTADDFETFDLNHPNRKDSGWLGTGVYLSSDPELARSYTMLKPGMAHPNIMPLYAKLENPYYATLQDKQRLQLISHGQGEVSGRLAADEWTQQLKDQGYDGVILEYRKEDVGSSAPIEYVVFDEAGVKSATGNQGTYDLGDQSVIRDEGATYKPGPQTRPAFYSVVEETIKKKIQGRSNPQQVMQMLAKTPGVKKDELDWLGLDQWMDGRDRVGRDELLEYIAENKVELIDDVRGYDPAALKGYEFRWRDSDGVLFSSQHATRDEALAAENEWLDNESNLLKGGEIEAVREVGDGQWVTGLGTIAEAPFYESRDEAEEARSQEIAQRRIDVTWNGTVGVDKFNEEKAGQYEEYTMLGGGNYRELIMTMPRPRVFEPGAEDRVRVEEESPGKWKVAEYSIKGRFSGYATGPTYRNRTAAERARLRYLERNFSLRSADPYRSGHWDEVDNPIVHVRTTDRTSPQGSRILFVEEVQSDWGQELRKGRPLRKLAKPDNIGKLANDFFGSEVAARIPLSEMDGSMLASGEHNQIFEAIVSLLPVDVVDQLGGREVAIQQLTGKQSVISRSLSIDARAAMASRILLASREVFAGIRAKLLSGLETGRDIELLPTLNASNLTAREVVGVLSPRSLYHVNLSGDAISGDVALFRAENAVATSRPTERDAEGFSASDTEFLNTRIPASLGAESGSAEPGGLDIKGRPARIAEALDWHNDILSESGILTPVSYKPTSAPSMPFSGTWHELALKKVLRLAAEEGYDGIAWTTGTQQSERYDIERHVQSVDWTAIDGDDTRIILNSTPREDAGNTTRREEVEFRNLDEWVGQDLATRIRNDYAEGDRSGSYDGLDLKIGDQGMATFYDQMIPTFLKKYAKKWGALPGTVEIGNARENLIVHDERGEVGAFPPEQEDLVMERYGDNPGFRMVREIRGGFTAHYLPVTPKMVDAVLHVGQPLHDEGATYEPGPPTRPAFYSVVEETVKKKIQGRSKPQQVMQMLAKTPGVKKDELDWLGLGQWMEGRDRVGRDELLEYIAEHKVELVDDLRGYESGEAIYTGPPNGEEYKTLAEAQAASQQWVDEWEEAYTRDYGTVVEGEEGVWHTMLPADVGRQMEFGSKEEAEAYSLQVIADKRRQLEEGVLASRQVTNTSQTQYDDYVLPAGKNYRELLLRLPDASNPLEISDRTQSPPGYEVFSHNDEGRNWYYRGQGVTSRVYDIEADAMEAKRPCQHRPSM